MAPFIKRQSVSSVGDGTGDEIQVALEVDGVVRSIVIDDAEIARQFRQLRRDERDYNAQLAERRSVAARTRSVAIDDADAAFEAARQQHESARANAQDAFQTETDAIRDEQDQAATLRQQERDAIDATAFAAAEQQIAAEVDPGTI